ncbi:MAG TPA: hypothetical protein PKX93_07120 [bacterium]|nr:hypothetical protein [bacterium]HOL67208.1 hypothetical protein [bacterium]HPP12403.1 hypothetical protein [bacterium]
MKKVFLWLFSPALLIAQPVPGYRFKTGQILQYQIELKGTTAYAFEGQPEEKLDVFVKASLFLITEKTEPETSTVRVEVRRSVIRIGGNTLEDLSSSETELSPTFGVSRLTLGSDGGVRNIEAAAPGLISLAGIFKLLPQFPRVPLTPGYCWKQSVPSLNFPGLPVANLEFTYACASTDHNQVAIVLSANQFLREKKSDRSISVTVQGRNSASGTFLFDCSAGELTSFSGNFSLNLKSLFGMPAGPEQRTHREAKLPVATSVNFTISLKKS